VHENMLIGEIAMLSCSCHCAIMIQASAGKQIMESETFCTRLSKYSNIEPLILPA